MKRRTDTTRKRPPKAAQRPATKRQDKAQPEHRALSAEAEDMGREILAKRLYDLAAKHPADREKAESIRAELNLPTVTMDDNALARLNLPAPMHPEEADRACQHDARRAIEAMLKTLRTGYEPDPTDIACLAALASAAADHLRTAAASPEASPLLDKALVPAACAAVALADLVNGPCLQHAPQAHAEARAAAERWPRIHYASAKRNKQEADHFKSHPISPSPRLQHGDDRAHTAAFSATLKAMHDLLPDAFHPAAFPVLPVLLDAGQPIQPRTAEGELSEPYAALARFILTVRHTHKRENKVRSEALEEFLAFNDEARARQPRAVRTRYDRTRSFLLHFVQNLHTENAGQHPAWLRPVAPVIGANTEAWSTTLHEVLRHHRLRILADNLLPIYGRAMADLAASAEHVAKPSKTAPRSSSGKS